MKEQEQDSYLIISIHAPTRGATEQSRQQGLHVPISIHAPTRGATKLRYRALKGNIFQSTLPREERRCRSSVMCSIKYFNPRSHERSDKKITYQLISVRYFNPRSHERSDDQQPVHSLSVIYFNPRSHERSDSSAVTQPSYLLFISIHAPTRGATSRRLHLPRQRVNFNPRSHERSDYCIHLTLFYFRYFNPRSHERSDIYCKFPKWLAI